MDNMHVPVRALADALGERFSYASAWDKTKAPAITPAREFFVGKLRPSLEATFAAVIVILVMACGNVAALMLGQVDARATEMAVRAALGANRQRQLQQLIIEALLVGALAGATGAALAAAGFELLVTSLPLGALADNARLDWTVFWAAMLAALAAAAIVAIVPGIALWRGSSLRATMATTRTGGVAARGGRLEGGLVIAQVALAVLLAAGAGLLIRSVTNLRAIDPGVRTDGVAIVDAVMPLGATQPQRKRIVLDMLPVLQALPGVKSVAAAQKLPLRGSGDNWLIRIQGRANEDRATTALRMVTRDYFTTLGLPILRGRNFDVSDREGSGRVVIVNEALAQKFFPNEDPLGRLLLTFDERGERIIGVVANAAEAALTDGAVPARYVLYEQMPFVYGGISFVVRADAEQQIPGVLSSARSAIGRVGVQLAIQETTTMTGGARARARRRRCLRRDVALRDAAVARLWHLHRARHAAVARRPPRRRTRRCARRRRQRHRYRRGGDRDETPGHIALWRRADRSACVCRGCRRSFCRRCPGRVRPGAPGQLDRPGGGVTRMTVKRRDPEPVLLGSLEEQVMLAVVRTEDEAYGMNVRRELEAVTGREVTIGSVYATLDRLEAKGFVFSSRASTADAPSRRVFAVTRAGARSLALTREMRERLWTGVSLRALIQS
jgi:hypothetical protein